MRTLSSIALVVVAAALPNAALAQRLSDGSTRPIRFGVSGGVAVPVGDFKDGFNSGALKRDLQQGVSAQGFVDLRAPGMPIGFRAAVSYTRFGFDRVQYTGTGLPGTPNTVALANADGESQILGGLANVTLQLPTGPIRPYVIAGLGAFNVKNSFEGTGTVAAGDVSETNFGINGGAGLAIRLGPIDGFVEGRIANVYTKQEKFGNLKNVQYVPVTFGFVF